MVTLTVQRNMLVKSAKRIHVKTKHVKNATPKFADTTFKMVFANLMSSVHTITEKVKLMQSL